jgi:hypothetical protein
MTGSDLVTEGAQMLPVLYPDPTAAKRAAPGLIERAQRYMSDPHPEISNIGFFLYGLGRMAEGGQHLAAKHRRGVAHA